MAAEASGSFETLAHAFRPVPIGVVNPHRLSAARVREFWPRRPNRLSERLTAGQREAVVVRQKSLPQLALGANVSALLRDPQILLLDEATSSVDPETELLIQNAVDRLRSGRTTFAIAHRLSTIFQADQILFVQGGRIVEHGTHRELLEADGEYARFFDIQFRKLQRA